jgi:hypothetical protein
MALIQGRPEMTVRLIVKLQREGDLVVAVVQPEETEEVVAAVELHRKAVVRATRHQHLRLKVLMERQVHLIAVAVAVAVEPVRPDRLDKAAMARQAASPAARLHTRAEVQPEVPPQRSREGQAAEAPEAVITIQAELVLQILEAEAAGRGLPLPETLDPEEMVARGSLSYPSPIQSRWPQQLAALPSPLRVGAAFTSSTTAERLPSSKV